MNIWHWIRPSSLSAAELCNGKPWMEMRAIERCPTLLRIVHVAAAQGTDGHGVTALALSSIYHGPDGWIQPDVALARLTRLLDALEPWTRDACRRCVAYVCALVDRETRAGHRVHIHVEMRLSGNGIGVPRGGTADVVLLRIDPTGCVSRAIVVDHKMGWLDQGHAAEHLQLAAYAVMAFDRWSPIDVEIHLAQGRIREFSAALFDGPAIETARQRILSVVEACSSGPRELRPSLEACRYCKALCMCAAAREEIVTAVDEASLFGIDTADRVKLAADAALARRFSEEARLLAAQWADENRAVAS